MNEHVFRLEIDKFGFAVEVKAMTVVEAEYKICDLLGYESMTELSLLLGVSLDNIMFVEI
jgi:hypothetical protein